jgi:acyl-CoA synthetase (AMP-forming)/AMP-acid ligase II
VQFSKKFPNATAGLSQGYGLTETNAIVTALAAEDSLLRPTSCGSAAIVNDIKIVNMDTNVEEPIGTAGEVLIKGESSRPCTLRRCPVLTIVVLNYKAPMSQVSIGTTLKQQRKRSPKMDGSNRAYFTASRQRLLIPCGFLSGDIGYLDEEGFLFLVDRAKDIVSLSLTCRSSCVLIILLLDTRLFEAGKTSLLSLSRTPYIPTQELLTLVSWAFQTSGTGN